MQRLCIGLIVLLTFNTKAQPVGDTIAQLVTAAANMLQHDYDKTMQLVAEVEKEAHQAGLQDHVSHVLEAYDIAITANRYHFHPQVCRQFLEKSSALLTKYKNELGEAYPAHWRDLKTQWAGFYFDVDDYASAYTLYAENLKDYLALSRTSENCHSLFQIAQYLAMIHERSGELEAAVNQLLASINYYTCYVRDQVFQNYALVFRNVGYVYLKKGDYSNANKYFSQAEDSLRSAWAKNNRKTELSNAAFTLYEVVSQYYIQQNKFDSALLALQKAEPYLKYSEPFRGRYHLKLGQLYQKSGDRKKAAKNLDKAIELIEIRGNKSVLLSDAYLAKGKLLSDEEQFDSSLEFFTKAMASLVLDFTPDQYGNPSLTNILSNKHLFDVLVAKYRLLENQYNTTKEMSVLQTAWYTHKLSIALLDSMGREFSNDKDKVILAEQSFSVYEDGVRMAHTLYSRTADDDFFNACFTLTDKSKGLLLLEKLRTVNSFAGVERKWLDEERDLRSELLQMEQELFTLANQPDNEHALLAARQEYANRKRDYAALMVRIRENSPAYYKVRFDHSVLAPADVQNKLLNDDAALVEFFMGEKTVTVFAFSKRGRFLAQKELPPGFTDEIINFRKGLSRPDDIKLSVEMQDKGRQFYSFLLKDALQSTGPVSELTIIPDGVLSFLPFEVLTPEVGEDPVYLVSRYAIRYGFSASYLGEQIEKKTEPTKTFFAGFVASGEGFSAANRNTQAPLPYAKQEVTLIAEILGSDYNLFEHATKHDFIKHAGDHKIVHLAMHSIVNHENPMFSSLLFASYGDSTSESSDLLAIELYGMQLKSELAVLSACETGVGTLHRGEGIMSFSRAFAYAGVPSAVISLWNVPDKATSMIMVKFYKFLKQGNRKDIALQRAKTEFIEAYPQMEHPFYWSGFVLMGDSKEVNFPSNTWIIWTIFISLGSAILLLLFWHMKIRFNPNR